MLVIPAIDIRKGRCVRLAQGNVRDETVFSKEPVSIAKLWQLKGAEYIHVIDLDGAITGSPKNLDIVFKIVKSVKVPVQLGGGIRDFNTLEEVFKGKVDRVILGTAALESLDFVKESYKKYKDKIIVGIDAKDNVAAIKGWKEVTDKNIFTLADEIKEIGIKTVIFTDVKKDGMLGGPNFKMIKEFARRTGLEVIASGGISTLEDVEHIRALEKYGVVGMIIGTALYTGKIDLKEAVKIGEKPLPADKHARKKKIKKRQKKKKKD